MSDNINIWIIGAGAIGQEYARLLSHIKIPHIVIGRSEKSVDEFKANIGSNVVGGGVDSFLENRPAMPTHVIVASTVTELAAVTNSLLEYGCQNILVEKPGAMSLSELEDIKNKASQCSAKIYIAYNRRFLKSVQKAKDIIQSDGGLLSFHFDFTEWPSRILAFEHPKGSLENWFYLNSTHIVDMAFHIGGWPTRIQCHTNGKLDWHPVARYGGSGVTEIDALFTYKADWQSAGRWGLEFMTPKRKLIMAPIETLQQQLVDTVSIEDIALDVSDADQFKPGFYDQVQAFIRNEAKNLVCLEDQIKHWAIYNKMNSGVDA